MAFRLRGIVLFFTLCEALTLNAQHGSSKSGKADSFFDQVWWGLGPNIGFGSVNGTNTFGIGLAGQAGYNFNESISLGPRINVFYTSVF